MSATLLQPLGGYQLKPEYYYEAAWFDREQRQLFGQQWTFVGFEHEIPNPGDYLIGDVGYQPVMVTRDLNGELHALHNVCRHRGIKMMSGCGNAKVISCPYHAWRYALDGKLEHVPQKKQQFPAMQMEDWGMFKAGLGVWDGLIFIHSNPDATPLLEWLGGLKTRLRRFKPDRLVPIVQQNYDMQANWKFFIENHIDWLHLYFLHAASLKDFHHDFGDLSQYGPHWTSFEKPRPGHEEDARRRKAGQVFIPGLLPEDSDIGAHLIFPNLAMFTSPTSFATVYARPTGPESCRVEIRTLGMEGSTPESFQSEDLEKVMHEDRSAAELLQAAVRSSRYEIGPMAMKWESPISHFHEHYAKARGL
jgi:phenylpropionate dioxygenase-like ring-hydroxylating dioxygenase large terminal subunit